MTRLLLPLEQHIRVEAFAAAADLNLPITVLQSDAWADAVLGALRAAATIETRSAKTEGLGPQDESVTAKPGRPEAA